MTQLLMTTSAEFSSTGIVSSISPFLKSTLVYPASFAFLLARSSISSVMSIPITLPLGVTFFADKNTSIPAPEPRSTTVSPFRKSANLTGAPQPTPRIDACGTDSSSLGSYPIMVAVLTGGSSPPPPPPEQHPGAQQEEEEPALLLSCRAILPYVLRIVFLISC